MSSIFHNLCNILIQADKTNSYKLELVELVIHNFKSCISAHLVTILCKNINPDPSYDYIIDDYTTEQRSYR